MKRVQVHAGGTVRILNDRSIAEPYTLLPDGNGTYTEKLYGLPVRLHILGRVLWPQPPGKRSRRRR